LADREGEYTLAAMRHSSARGGWLAASAALAIAAPISLGAATSRADPAPAPSAVELRVVTYNTHGLPAWIAGDDPARRFPVIGRLLDAYDLAVVQEDFFHHELLLGAITLPLRARGNEGSGLTTLARLPARVLVETEAEPYGVCSGWILGANDCLGDKGFLRTRIALPNGARVDFVNTHLDAGRGDDDRAARRAQLEILAERLRRASANVPLVVGGDLNLHHDDPLDRALLDGFAAALDLADSGARPAPGSGWGRIDYLLYRPGADVALEVLEAGMAAEFVHEGAPLSDHPALWARLRVGRIE
jgi:endonuclease/exonuclease/phosphatase (EEP) superfamily protein YafD